jgi:hypothetical protein
MLLRAVWQIKLDGSGAVAAAGCERVPMEDVLSVCPAEGGFGGGIGQRCVTLRFIRRRARGRLAALLGGGGAEKDDEGLSSEVATTFEARAPPLFATELPCIAQVVRLLSRRRSSGVATGSVLAAL